jgi:iron(III) transport system substrate-binding protein
MISALLLAALTALTATPVKAAWQDSPEVKALYEKAKAEGKVIVWGPQRNEVDWIPKAFGDMFPGIEVTWVGDNDTITRAIAEARAGRNEVDVFWNSLSGADPLVQRDLIAKVDWHSFGVDPKTTAFDGRAAYATNTAYVLAYNRDLANKSDLPKNWADLTDPKYKGKMTSSLFLLPRLIGALSVAWGKDKAIQFARDLTGKQEIALTRSPREPMINSGERIYGVGEIDSLVRIWGKAGLKIDYVVPEPIVLTQFVSTMMAKAPHPNAALLLAGYMVTPEGKAARKAVTLAEDYGPAGTSELAQRINSGKAEVVRDLPEQIEQREKAIAEMGPIVAGQK